MIIKKHVKSLFLFFFLVAKIESMTTSTPTPTTAQNSQTSTPATFNGAEYIPQWKKLALTKAQVIMGLIQKVKNATVQAEANQANIDAAAELNKFNVYAFAYLIGKRYSDFFALKTQLDADLNDLDKKAIDAYAGLQALNLSALVADTGQPRQYFDSINLLASSIEPTDPKITAKAVNPELLAQGQTYFTEVRKALSAKILSDAQANLEKIFAQRVKTLTAQYAASSPDLISEVNKLADDIIAKIDAFLATPDTAAADVKTAAKASLKSVIAQRPALRALFAKVLEAKVATEKAAADKIVADSQQAAKVVQDTVTQIIQIKGYAPNEAVNAEKLTPLLNETLKKLQGAQTPEQTQAALTELKSLQKQAEDLKASATKSAIANILIATLAEDKYAKDIVASAAQYKTVAPTQVATIEQSAKIVADSLAKVQAAQTPEVAVAALNDAVAQRKPLQDTLATINKAAADKAVADKAAADKAAAETAAINDAVKQIGDLNTAATAVDMAKYPAATPEQTKAVADAKAKLAELVKTVADAQKAGDGVTAVKALADAKVQDKILQDTLTAAKASQATANTNTINDALKQVGDLNTAATAVDMTKYPAATPEQTKIVADVKAKLAEYVKVVTDAQKAGDAAAATKALADAKVQDKVLQDTLAAVKATQAAADKAAAEKAAAEKAAADKAIADAKALAVAEDALAQKALESATGYAGKIDAEIAKVQAARKLVADALAKTNQATTPNDAKAASDQAVNQRKATEAARDAANKAADDKAAADKAAADAKIAIDGSKAAAKADDDKAQLALNSAINYVGKIDAEVAKVQAARKETADALAAANQATTPAAAKTASDTALAKRQATEAARDAANKAADDKAAADKAAAEAKAAIDSSKAEAKADDDKAQLALDSAVNYAGKIDAEVAKVQVARKATADALVVTNNATTPQAAATAASDVAAKRQATETARSAANKAADDKLTADKATMDASKAAAKADDDKAQAALNSATSYAGAIASEVAKVQAARKATADALAVTNGATTIAAASAGANDTASKRQATEAARDAANKAADDKAASDMDAELTAIMALYDE